MCINFYYQIKGRGISDYGGNWAWPPVLSGMVTAGNKKEAKAMIEKEYEIKLPLRVLSKDLDKEHYLLHIREIDKNDDKTNGLFKLTECKQCKSKFRIIDKYNDVNELDKGSDFCSYDCKQEDRAENRIKQSDSISMSGIAVIYKITNKKTNKSYIGQTTQIFTLRWYQHFYQNGSCKFHNAINKSKLTDWDFTLLEVVKTTNSDSRNKKEIIDNREMHWINKFNSIENGYNSLAPIKQIKELS